MYVDWVLTDAKKMRFALAEPLSQVPPTGCEQPLHARRAVERKAEKNEPASREGAAATGEFLIEPSVTS